MGIEIFYGSLYEKSLTILKEQQKVSITRDEILNQVRTLRARYPPIAGAFQGRSGEEYVEVNEKEMRIS